MNEYKIIFTGTTGAGKTTAIAAVSDIPPVNTDVVNNDTAYKKEKTTVGFDYGEVSISDTERLRLYGTPGQERFGFMWKVLGRGALGVILLIDYSRPQPLEDLKLYTSNFMEIIEQSACVIGISKVTDESLLSVDNFADYLLTKGIICPIVPVDVRDKKQVLLLLDILLTQLEAKS